MIARGSKVMRLPDTAEAARTLITEIANHEALALQIQTEMVDRALSFDQLAATRELNIEREKLRQQHLAEKNRLREEQRKAEELHREKQLLLQRETEDRARQARIQHHADIRKYCANKKPFGSCDRCKSQLKNHDTVYHCCSCHSDDWYWHCGSCGHDCGNDEHPYMAKLVRSNDCVIM